MTKKTELATKEDNLPAYMNQGQARGQENVTVDDLSVPRLDVIQALSPQRKKSAPEYIEGAEEGMLYNSVTSQLYGLEVEFIPSYFRKEYLIWKDRDAGGGFGGSYKTEAEAVAECGKLGPDYAVSDTAMHFGILLHGDRQEEVVVSMSRSKLKASRQLNTLCKMAGGDRFANKFKVASVEVKGDKGDYFNFNISRIGWATEPEYKAGEALYEAVASGDKDVNREYDEPKATEEEEY